VKEASTERIATGGAGESLAALFAEPAGVRAELTVLYLHGFGSRQDGEKATYFRERATAEGWAFCSFDFRGHGDSEGELRDLTLTRNLEDVAAVRAWLRDRGQARVALFGSSMGGATALWHAAREPEGLVAAALVAPAVGMAAGMERWAGPERLERWERDGVVRYASEVVESDLRWELMEDLRRFDLGELAAALRTPTLIFQGQRDTSVDWHDVATFAAHTAPGVVELRLYSDGDHRLTDRKGKLWDAAAAWYRRHLA
jgi:pimeloyl-ACP methyl ester carboxylesterase